MKQEKRVQNYTKKIVPLSLLFIGASAFADTSSSTDWSSAVSNVQIISPAFITALGIVFSAAGTFVAVKYVLRLLKRA